LRHVPKLVVLLTAVAATLTGTTGFANAATPSLSASAVTPVWGTYQTVAPARVLDTRVGTGARKGPVGSGGTISMSMPVTSGVPATGVSAVVLNLTVTGATKPGYLTAWPAGTTRPTASGINFVAGANRANLITVPLGTIGSNAGRISIYNALGTVQVIADVMGYYVADGATTAGGLYQRQSVPQRMLDTREAWFGGPLDAGWSAPVVFDYNDPATPAIDINSHITAVAVNITAVRPTAPGYLTAWDGSAALPTTSTLNFVPGAITPNMAIVPVGPCLDCTGAGYGLPSISVLNGSAGTIDILVDVVGFFDDGQLGDGFRFKPLTPTRIVDTRTGLGTTTFAGNQAKSIIAPASVAGNDTYCLVTNTTAVRPTMSTFLTMWDADETQPLVSNLNAAKGQIVANATITDVGMGNMFDVYNSAGATDVVVDVMGSMEFIPNTVLTAARAVSTPKTWTSHAPAQPSRSWTSKPRSLSAR
jgi:hypothetical protein